MALSATLIGSKHNGWNGTAGSSPLTVSCTDPGANALILVLVNQVSDDATPFSPFSASGASLTWTVIGNTGSAANFTAGAGALYAKTTTAPGSFTLSITSDMFGALYVVSVYAITGHDTTTPIGGKAFQGGQNGNGAVSATLDAAPASGDLTFAQCLTDENSNNRFATFGTGTWTTVLPNPNPPTDNLQSAYNSGYRSGSTSTTVPWSDVNSGNDNFGSSQGAVVVKAAAAGGTDATATPSVVTATASVGTATPSVGSTITASVVTRTASVPAPAATVGQTVSASVVTATASVGSPAASGGATASPSTVTASAAGLQPSPSVGQTITATVVTASVSVGSPSVDTANGVTATPDTVTATAAVSAPTVAVGQTVTTTVVTATVSIPEPAVSAAGNASVTATVVTASVSVGSPSSSAGATAAPSTVTALAAGVQPALSTGQTVSAATVTAAAAVMLALANAVTTLPTTPRGRTWHIPRGTRTINVTGPREDTVT